MCLVLNLGQSYNLYISYQNASDISDTFYADNANIAIIRNMTKPECGMAGHHHSKPTVAPRELTVVPE